MAFLSGSFLIMNTTFTFIFLIGVTLANPHPGSDKPLIVGGTEATLGEFPYIVNFKSNGFDCGGTIINQEWILTAAHCTQDEAGTISVVAGDHDKTKTEGTEQIRVTTQIINHKGFSWSTRANDISLLKLNSSLLLNDAVQAISLATQDPSGDVTVAGWGALFIGGAPSDVLMKVTVPMVATEICRDAHGEIITDGMICAGIGGKDSCHGDSGGPLVTESGELAGVISWGNGCADPAYPGVYSSVTYYTNWILENMKDG